MNKLSILFFLILTFCKPNGQDLKGIWISTHSMELWTVNETSEIRDDEFVTIKLNSPKIDTSYHGAYVLLDFINDKNVVVKIFSVKQENCNYSIKNNHLEIKGTGLKLKGRISDNRIVLSEKTRTTTTRQTFFERIVDSKITDKAGLDSISFINTNWVVETDTTSHNYGYNFYFADSSIVMISKFSGGFGYTDWGTWKIHWYKNHCFLGIMDEYWFESMAYHIIDKAGDTLIGNTYEFNYSTDGPPSLKEIVLRKKELPDTSDLTILEQKLFGKWIAVNNPLSLRDPFGKYYDDVDTLLEQKYEIDFKNDKTFRLEKSAIIVKQGEKTYKHDSLSGKWEISKTGKYIILNPENNGDEEEDMEKIWTRYLTINKLENDYLEMFCDVESIYEENWSSNETIKLKK